MSDDLKSVETQVLEIVLHNDIDYSEIGKRVAIEYPAIFLMMASNYSDNSKIKSLIIQGKMLEAIKTRRTLTSEGLKEAKDYCDAFVSNFVNRGITANDLLRMVRKVES